MAGDNHMLHDPAIDRWAAMRENVYQHFKLTRRATRTVVWLGLVVPATLAAAAWVYDDKYDFAGKTRGTSLLRTPPPAPEAQE